jgi:hypothetical protein
MAKFQKPTSTNNEVLKDYVPEKSERNLFHVGLNTQLLEGSGARKKIIDNWHVSKYSKRDFEDLFINSAHAGLPPRGAQLGYFTPLTEEEAKKKISVFDTEDNKEVIMLLYSPGDIIEGEEETEEDSTNANK